jgi:hypothetical protein
MAGESISVVRVDDDGLDANLLARGTEVLRAIVSTSRTHLIRLDRLNTYNSAGNNSHVRGADVGAVGSGDDGVGVDQRAAAVDATTLGQGDEKRELAERGRLAANDLVLTNLEGGGHGLGQRHGQGSNGDELGDHVGRW